MNILVTGGAGFIGSHLALAAKNNGHKVHIVDSFDTFYNPAIKHKNARMLSAAGILVHQLDLSMDPLEPILEKIDFVIHTAGQPGISSEVSYFSYIKNNFQATVALLEAIQGTHIGLIHVSTSSIYGINACGPEDSPAAPASAYGVTKLAAEEAVLSSVRQGLIQACVLRYFSVYGERERPDKLVPILYSALKHDTEFPLYEGSAAHERSYTYVGDIVEGTMLAMSNLAKVQGEIFNLGNPIINTTGEVLELAQSISGKKLKIKNLPARAGDQLVTRANIAKAKNLLGYQPRYGIKEGLEKTWVWAQKEL